MHQSSSVHWGLTKLDGMLRCTRVLWCSWWCCQTGLVKRRWTSSSPPSPPCLLLAQCTIISSGMLTMLPGVLCRIETSCWYDQRFSSWLHKLLADAVHQQRSETHNSNAYVTRAWSVCPVSAAQALIPSALLGQSLNGTRTICMLHGSASNHCCVCSCCYICLKLSKSVMPLDCSLSTVWFEPYFLLASPAKHLTNSPGHC